MDAVKSIKPMKLYDQILSTAAIVAGITILALMIVQISLDAFLRTAFAAPLPATVEIVSNYYMVALSFLPIALVQRRGRNIEATFVYDAMPRIAQVVARTMTRVLAIAIYSLFTWQSYHDAVAKTRINAYVLAGSGEVPIWPCYWVIPISFALMVLALLVPSSSDPHGRAEEAGI